MVTNEQNFKSTVYMTNTFKNRLDENEIRNI